jgi:hypothetical protein
VCKLELYTKNFDGIKFKRNYIWRYANKKWSYALVSSRQGHDSYCTLEPISTEPSFIYEYLPVFLSTALVLGCWIPEDWRVYCQQVPTEQSNVPAALTVRICFTITRQSYLYLLILFTIYLKNCVNRSDYTAWNGWLSVSDSLRNVCKERPPLWSSGLKFLATDREVSGSIPGTTRFSEK